MDECEGIGKHPQFYIMLVYFYFFLGTEFIVSLHIFTKSKRQKGRKREEKERDREEREREK